MRDHQDGKLEDKAKLLTSQFGLIFVGNGPQVCSIQQDPAGGRFGQAVSQVEPRDLAGTGAAGDDHKFVVLDLQALFFMLYFYCQLPIVVYERGEKT